jgi:hypothetical protein
LDSGDCFRARKFYWEQVDALEKLLVKLVRQTGDMDVDKYLRVCEQLGQEPDSDKMPLDASDFPAEVQVAFFISGMLSDVWDGTSGSYMGKDWSHADQLFKLYEVEEPKIVMYFAKMYERLVINYRAEEQTRKRDADERKANKASGGGKNYTHNVNG